MYTVTFLEKLVTFFHITGMLALLHANVLLFFKTMISRDCTGISGKSQILFAVAHFGQYINVLYTKQSSFIVVLGLFVLIYALLILSGIYFFERNTYQYEYDNFRSLLMILVCIFLTLFANCLLNFLRLLKTFSDYLEAVAMIPQLWFIAKARKIDINVYHFIVLMTVYKSLYVAVDILEGFQNLTLLTAGIGNLVSNLYFCANEFPSLFRRYIEEHIV